MRNRLTTTTKSGTQRDLLSLHFRLERDFDDSKGSRRLLADAQVRQCSPEFAEKVSSQVPQKRAWTLTGPYGTGSRLRSFLAHLLSSPKRNVISQWPILLSHGLRSWQTAWIHLGGPSTSAGSAHTSTRPLVRTMFGRAPRAGWTPSKYVAFCGFWPVGSGPTCVSDSHDSRGVLRRMESLIRDRPVVRGATAAFF